jgi:hypothetical protein
VLAIVFRRLVPDANRRKRLAVNERRLHHHHCCCCCLRLWSEWVHWGVSALKDCSCSSSLFFLSPQHLLVTVRVSSFCSLLTQSSTIEVADSHFLNSDSEPLSLTAPGEPPGAVPAAAARRLIALARRLRKPI